MLSDIQSKTCEFNAKLYVMNVIGSLRSPGPHPAFSELYYRLRTPTAVVFITSHQFRRTHDFYTTHSDLIHSLVFLLVAFVIALPYKVQPVEDVHTYHCHVCRMKFPCQGPCQRDWMGRNSLLVLAQSCHKFPLLLHPHLWLLEFSTISCFWPFLQWEGPGRRIRQKPWGPPRLLLHSGLFWMCKGTFLALTWGLFFDSFHCSPLFVNGWGLFVRFLFQKQRLLWELSAHRFGIFLLLSRVLRISSSLFRTLLGKFIQTLSAWGHFYGIPMVGLRLRLLLRLGFGTLAYAKGPPVVYGFESGSSSMENVMEIPVVAWNICSVKLCTCFYYCEQVMIIHQVVVQIHGSSRKGSLEKGIQGKSL